MEGGSSEGGLRGIGISIPNAGVKAMAGSSNLFSLGVGSTRVIQKLRMSRVKCLGARVSLGRGGSLSALAI